MSGDQETPPIQPRVPSALGLSREDEVDHRLHLLEEAVAGIGVRIRSYLDNRDREKRPVSLEGIRSLLRDLAEGIGEHMQES